MRGPARLLAAVHRPSKCTVLLCVFAALACTAAGVEPSEGNPFPCEIQGKWTTLSSDYKGDPLGDGHVEVECDVAGKELHVSADGRVLQTGAQCPTNAETGQGDDPPYFARTEALFTSLTAHTPWDGGSGSGCFCFYAHQSDDDTVAQIIDVMNAFFGPQSAASCVRYQRAGNEMIIMADVFRFADNELIAPICPDDVEWGPDDNGRSRYRDVLRAVGPVERVRASNTHVEAGAPPVSVLVFEDARTRGVDYPTSSLAALPMCAGVTSSALNVTVSGNGTLANATDVPFAPITPTDHILDPTAEKAVLVLAVAILVVLGLSWCACCCLVWSIRVKADAAPPASELIDATDDRVKLNFVIFAFFMHVFSVSLILPALTPLAVDELFDGDTQDAAVFLTALNAAASFIEFFCGPYFGAMSDQRGRKPFLTMSVVATSGTFALVGLAPSKFTFIVSGVARGVTSIGSMVGFTMVVDVSKQASEDAEAVAKNTGLMLAAGALGILLGPVIGGGLGIISPRVPFGLAAVVDMFNGFYVYFLVPETKKTRDVPFDWIKSNPFNSLKLLVAPGAKVLHILTAIFVVQNFAFAPFTQGALYADLRFGWDALDLGAFLSYAGLLLVVSQVFIAKVVVPALGELKSLTVGLCIGVVQLILLGLAVEGWQWYVSFLVTVLTFATGPALRGMIAKEVPRDLQGRLQGSLQSLNTITSGLGPVAAAAVFVWSTESVTDGEATAGTFDAAAGLMFFYGALLLVVCLALVWVLQSKIADGSVRLGPPEPQEHDEPLTDGEGSVGRHGSVGFSAAGATVEDGGAAGDMGGVSPVAEGAEEKAAEASDESRGASDAGDGTSVGDKEDSNTATAPGIEMGGL